MSTIIAGRFDLEENARHAFQALQELGYPRDRITSFYVTPPGQHAVHGTPADPDASAGAPHAGRGAGIGAAGGPRGGSRVRPGTGPQRAPARPLLASAVAAPVARPA